MMQTTMQIGNGTRGVFVWRKCLNENLINYINIFDNNYNVYRLLKDKVNNYVSDYYISQRQETLAKRDMLNEDNGRFLYTVPIFQDNEVMSNIIININFEQYKNYF